MLVIPALRRWRQEEPGLHSKNNKKKNPKQTKQRKIEWFFSMCVLNSFKNSHHGPIMV
jgi:hypothetical protein